MTSRMIDQLTSEQKKLIHSYGEKWRQIAFSTEPVDRKRITETVKAASSLTTLEEPEIVFCESPYTALKTSFVKPLLDIVLSRPKNQMTSIVCKRIIGRKLGQSMRKKIKFLSSSRKYGGMNKIRKQLGWELCYQVRELHQSLEWELADRSHQLHKLSVQMMDQVVRDTIAQFDSQLVDTKWIAMRIRLIAWKIMQSFHPLRWISLARDLDCYYSVLSCPHSQKRWEIFSGLAELCSWSFLYEKKCVLCERPRLLSFDSKNRLHGEGEPAIQFANGYSLYAYRGVIIPEKYGKIPPSQWKGKWLLEEADPRLKKVLIHGLGGYEPSFEESETLAPAIKAKIHIVGY